MVDASPVHQSGSEKDAVGTEPTNQTRSNETTTDPVGVDSSSTATLELTVPTNGDAPISVQQASELNGTAVLPTYDEGDASVFNRKSVIGPSVGSYSAALLSPLDSLTAPFDPPTSFPALQANAEVPTQKNLGNESSDTLSELMTGGEHELAFLSRHFCETLGPWYALSRIYYGLYN